MQLILTALDGFSLYPPLTHDCLAPLLPILPFFVWVTIQLPGRCGFLPPCSSPFLPLCHSEFLYHGHVVSQDLSPLYFTCL